MSENWKTTDHSLGGGFTPLPKGKGYLCEVSEGARIVTWPNSNGEDVESLSIKFECVEGEYEGATTGFFLHVGGPGVSEEAREMSRGILCNILNAAGLLDKFAERYEHPCDKEAIETIIAKIPGSVMLVDVLGIDKKGFSNASQVHPRNSKGQDSGATAEAQSASSTPPAW